LICLVSTGANKSGSIAGSTSKSKLIRRSSAKLRKPSLRTKDAGKSKNNDMIKKKEYKENSAGVSG
jgi:hypothetical protein